MSITVPRQGARCRRCRCPKRDALDGVRDMLPVGSAAYAPLGLVVGGHVAASDNPVGAWLGTWVIYGGAAQLGGAGCAGAGLPAGWPRRWSGCW